MAQDLLDRFTPLHHQPANVTGGLMMVPVLFHGHTALKAKNAELRTAYFKSVMNPLFNSSGAIITIEWFSSSTTGTVTFQVAFERHSTSFNYASGLGFAVARTVTASPNALANRPTYSTLSFTPTQMASIVKLESYRLSIARISTDTLGADAYISTVSLKNLT